MLSVSYQADDVEKSSWVREMGNPYRAAQQVVAWPGPAGDSSATSIKALSYIGQQAMGMSDGPCLEPCNELYTSWLLVRGSDGLIFQFS